MFSTLLSNTQPVIVLLIGVAILSFVAYINWIKGFKPGVIRWIAKHVFGSELQSEISADRLFMNVTVLLLVIGLLWLGLGIGYPTS
jgi:hypothetical protein